MIEVLPDMPDGVTGIRVSGRLRGDELREVRPVLEETVKTGEVRIVEVIASDYEGLVAHTLHALAWMVPGELAVFALDDLERAKDWAAG